MSLKLISEIVNTSAIKPLLVEEIDTLSGNQVKNWYLSGPFIVAEERNKNGRIYKRNIIEREVENFTKEKIQKNRAAGELNHPESPSVNLDRISHYITELKNDGGHIWAGKAKLANTPMGIVAQTLVKDGYNFGVSTRGLGEITDDGEVSDDYKLITIDLVSEPSCHNAFAEAIYENRNYIIENGEIFEAPLNNFSNRLKVLPKRDVNKYIAESIVDFITEMRNRK